SSFGQTTSLEGNERFWHGVGSVSGAVAIAAGEARVSMSGKGGNRLPEESELISGPRSESALRVEIVDTFERLIAQERQNLTSAVRRADATYLRRLGLTRSEITSLLTRNKVYKA